MFIGVIRALGASRVTTFDSAHTAATVTLSNGNLTATANSDAADGAISRSNASHSAGKYYASVLVVTDPHIGGFDFLGVGVANANQVLTQFLGETFDGVSMQDDGRVFRNNGTIDIWDPFVQGDRIDLATDVDNKKLWWRVNGGNWNADILANQNPATNTGGTDISAGPTGPLFFAVDLERNTYSVTVNFGATAYAFAAPAGFGNW